MRIRIDDLDENAIQKRIAKGYGQGDGENYVPWLNVRNISSKGRSCRVLNPKNGRIVTCFSKLEEHYFYKLLWSDSVIDIREQYPLLPRSETQIIAEGLCVRHPRIPYAVNDMVMTTDFLLTIQDDNREFYSARYVKPKKELEKNRIREKYMIEKEYWARKGIELKIVTEDSINLTESENIARVMEYYRFDRVSIEPIGRYLREQLVSYRSDSLMNICRKVDNRFQLTSGDSLKYLFHLIAVKEILVDLKKQKLLGTAMAESVIDIIGIEEQFRKGNLHAYNA